MVVGGKGQKKNFLTKSLSCTSFSLNYFLLCRDKGQFPSIKGSSQFTWLMVFNMVVPPRVRSLACLFCHGGGGCPFYPPPFSFTVRSRPRDFNSLSTVVVSSGKTLSLRATSKSTLPLLSTAKVTGRGLPCVRGRRKGRGEM